MSDIVTFLTARLDEDEQLAREAEYSSAGGIWLFEGPPSDGKSRPGRLKLGDGPWLVSDPELRSPTFGDNFDGHQMEHIARHDPARGLAEVAAKRRVVARHYPVPASDVDWTSCGHCRGVTWPCPDLRDAAAPFADCPDYDQSWRPDAPD